MACFYCDIFASVLEGKQIGSRSTKVNGSAQAVGAHALLFFKDDSFSWATLLKSAIFGLCLYLELAVWEKFSVVEGDA